VTDEDNQEFNSIFIKKNYKVIDKYMVLDAGLISTPEQYMTTATQFLEDL